MKKLACLSLLFLFACGGIPKEGLQGKDVSDQFEIIYQSNFNGVSEKSYHIIQNSEDYKAFFILMKEDKVPEVDFNKSNVLVLNMGEKNSGGYNVLPEKMIDDGKKLIMTIKEISPDKDQMVTMGMTSPVCIVKINSKKEILIK
ncbi:protease complex subunit PrcB family protein [Flavobacterium sp.]|uniref:protease complex subunit PrcB family protein n=1 Tax=Flavobacterium sp. TaxID=239 RepID=UPI00260D52A2|nr:protease complex subunit PrcB family protein [Flavobacterium sp.]